MKRALLLCIATASTAGCAQTLALDQGHYQVEFKAGRVNSSPVETHEFSIGDARFRLEEVTYVYAIHGEEPTSFGGALRSFFVGERAYQDVMYAGFARVTNGRLHVEPMPDDQLVDAMYGPLNKELFDVLKQHLPGSECSLEGPDSVADLRGIVAGCTLRHSSGEQRLRVRALVGEDGVLCQAVSWVGDEKGHSWATAFWNSLQPLRRAPSSASPRPLDRAELASLMSRVLTSRASR